MGTQQKTDTTNKYDPTSMQAFQQATPAWMQPAQQFAQNPYGGQQFQFEQQMGNRQAQNLGQTGMSNLSRNAISSGMGGGNMSPAFMEMMQNQGRANTGLQAQLGFMNPMQLAGGRQQNAMQLLQGYRPLQTGGTQVQSQSGLGTWLPQLLGAGMGMAGGAMTGGLSGMFGGGKTSGGFSGGSMSALGGSNLSNQNFIGGLGGTPPWMGGGGLQAPGGAGAGGGSWWGGNS